MREMLEFAMVLLVVLLVFTMSFHALFRDFDTYCETCLNLLKAMLGEVSFFDDFPDERYKAVATALLVIYLITITIMMLNLLIAVLSTSHAKVQENAEEEYRLLKAHLIHHYRLVVRDDLLPAPFNWFQLPFRRHNEAKRSVGNIVFWIVLGPAAVVGGAILWIVSAFLNPVTPMPRAWTFTKAFRLRNEDGGSYPRLSRGWKAAWPVFWFVRRALGCPLELLGLWFIRPFAWVTPFVRRSLHAGTGDGDVTAVNTDVVRVDTVLEQQDGGVTARKLLEFLVNPLSDKKVVREDERKRNPSVEHIKLLRDRLEERIKLVEETIVAKVGTPQASIDKLHAAVAPIASSNERPEEHETGMRAHIMGSEEEKQGTCRQRSFEKFLLQYFLLG